MNKFNSTLLVSLALAFSHGVVNADPDPDKGIGLLAKLNSPEFAKREKAFADLANHIELQFRKAAVEVRSELGTERAWPEVKAAVDQRMEENLFSALRAEAKKHGAEVVSRIRSIEPHRIEFARSAALLAGLDAPTDFEMELASKGVSEKGAIAALS